jgi:hypothetical protein
VKVILERRLGHHAIPLAVEEEPQDVGGGVPADGVDGLVDDAEADLGARGGFAVGGGDVESIGGCLAWQGARPAEP